MIKVYVAASSSECGRAKAFMYRLREMGCLIMGDWTGPVERLGANAGLTMDQRVEAAEACIGGISSCDIVCMLWPKTPTRGAWFECGYAFGLMVMNQDVCLMSVGGNDEDTIFSLCFERVPDEDAALSAIANFARCGTLLAQCETSTSPGRPSC